MHGARQTARTLAIGVLRDHQQFQYTRRLLSRSQCGIDSERLRQQHALRTYKNRAAG